MLEDLFTRDSKRYNTMVAAQIVPEPVRCVQCGICSYNCPIEIDVRAYARRGKPISSSRCLTCGECIARCPRGTLRFERSSIFELE